jgi:hypothetical protein
MIAQHYWLEFHQLKAHINYVELCLAKTERIDRALKILLGTPNSIGTPSTAGRPSHQVVTGASEG